MVLEGRTVLNRIFVCKSNSYARRLVRFSQLALHFNRSRFNRIAAKYQGDGYIKTFSCWNQLKVLMFGQLSQRESLRDLIVAVEAHCGKAKFLGFGDSVTRSNLAKANQNRDCRIFEEYAYYMMELLVI